MDAAWVASDGTFTVHAGTLAHSHGALRLPLAVPCVSVSGDGLSLHVHATERAPGAADDALFFTPYAFLCAPATADAVRSSLSHCGCPLCPTAAVPLRLTAPARSPRALSRSLRAASAARPRHT